MSELNLPYSYELNIGYLSRLFDNTSNCYKFFWFMAIQKMIEEGRLSFTYNDLINEMIITAWYMVIEYHLRLGPIGVKDNLEELVKYISDEYGFESTISRKKLIGFLETSGDKKIISYKNELIKNVPYRLQVPFYDGINISGSEWGKYEELTHKINQQRRLIYYFDIYAGTNTVVTVDDKWAEYLGKHKEILKNWTQFNLIKYLQKRNPSISGIVHKIEPPVNRKIDDVSNYWKLIISKDGSIRDIYGNVELINEKISVDHFVPWQFVAHDELWNLHPTTKSINSSKSNNLPSWNIYFEKLCHIEFMAYDICRKDDIAKNAFDKIAAVHLNDQTIKNSLYNSNIEEPEFSERLEHILKPVYESAYNCGFKEWTY